MKRRFDDPVERELARNRIAGLGERSIRKSYYPELQQRVAELERFRALLDHASDAIFLLDGLGVLVDANASACAQLGRERAQLLGQHLEAFIDEPGRSALAKQLRDAPDPRRPPLSAGLLRGDGGRLPVEVSVRRVALEEGVFAVVVARDVAEREQMAAQLALADRLVSLGTLAAGVAHEINNPLAYVIANQTFVAEELQALDAEAARGAVGPRFAERLREIRAAVEESRSGAERVRQIVRDLRVFSRADSDVREAMDARAAVETALTLTAAETKQVARVVKELPGPLPVHGNEGRLAQVFINLLVNAAQAFRTEDASVNEIRVKGWLAGRHTCVAVEDNGPGIPAENLARLFDPFFTTKPRGVGTGLGLAICHGIVAAHGGELVARSEPGRGATFVVRLPSAVAR